MFHMKQRERRAWILETLKSGPSRAFMTLAVGGEYASVGAMPFGLSTRPNHIHDGFDADWITAEQSFRLIIDAVGEIPDQA